MSADHVVGDAQGHPHGASLLYLAVAGGAHHLHDPGLVGVADGEGLTLGVVAILLRERGHHVDGLAGGLRALQGDVDERAVVEDARGVDHLLASAEGGLADGYLPLVDVANDVVGLLGLRYLAVVFIRVPVIHLQHLPLGVLGGRTMDQALEHAVAVSRVGADDGAVLRSPFSYDEVCTCHSTCGHHGHCQ